LFFVGDTRFDQIGDSDPGSLSADILQSVVGFQINKVQLILGKKIGN
jgi:hypothetical protein